MASPYRSGGVRSLLGNGSDSGRPDRVNVICADLSLWLAGTSRTRVAASRGRAGIPPVWPPKKTLISPMGSRDECLIFMVSGDFWNRPSELSGAVWRFGRQDDRTAIRRRLRLRVSEGCCFFCGGVRVGGVSPGAGGRDDLGLAHPDVEVRDQPERGPGQEDVRERPP